MLLLYISTSLLLDNFDRIRLEFVGFKKVVFVVVRFLGNVWGRSIQPFGLIGSCRALFIARSAYKGCRVYCTVYPYTFSV